MKWSMGFDRANNKWRDKEKNNLLTGIANSFEFHISITRNNYLDFVFTLVITLLEDSLLIWQAVILFSKYTNMKWHHFVLKVMEYDIHW